MKYYILLPNDKESDTHFETNELGEDNGFGVFWGAYGLKTLMTIVDRQPELLPHITIKTDKGKSLDVAEFLINMKKIINLLIKQITKAKLTNKSKEFIQTLQQQLDKIIKQNETNDTTKN